MDDLKATVDAVCIVSRRFVFAANPSLYRYLFAEPYFLYRSQSCTTVHMEGCGYRSRTVLCGYLNSLLVSVVYGPNFSNADLPPWQSGTLFFRHLGDVTFLELWFDVGQVSVIANGLEVQSLVR